METLSPFFYISDTIIFLFCLPDDLVMYIYASMYNVNILEISVEMFFLLYFSDTIIFLLLLEGNFYGHIQTTRPHCYVN